MESVKLSINNVVPNKGQIEGVPKNPRFIKDEKFAALKDSIVEDPDMLELRELLVYPLQNKFVIIGGNMRYEACKELGHQFVHCKILAADTPVEKLRRIVLKDNGGYGEWDHELLSSQWHQGEILSAGIEIPIPPDPTDAPIPQDNKLRDISTKLFVEAGDLEALRDLFIELQQRGFVCELK